MHIADNHLQDDKVRNGQRIAFRAIAFISFIVVLGFVFITATIISDRYLHKMSRLSQEHLNNWENIHQEVIYTLSRPPDRPLILRNAEHSQAQVTILFKEAQSINEKIDKIIHLMSPLINIFHHSEEEKEILYTASVDDSIKHKVTQFIDAPFGVLQGGFSYWDTTSEVKFRTGQALQPLKNRIEIIHNLTTKSLSLLSIVLGIVFIMLLFVIWAAWLRMLAPTYRMLRRALETEHIQFLQLSVAQEKLARSESEMRIVLDNLPAMVASVSLDYKYLSINETYRDMLGISKNINIRGLHVREILGDSLWEKNKKNLESAVDGEVIKYDVLIDTTIGPRYVQAIYAPIYDSNNQVERVLALIIDMHEQKVLQNALKEREENFRITLDSMGDGIIATDNILNITHINPVAEKLLGSKNDEVIGRKALSVFKIFDTETGVALPNPARTTLKTKEIVVSAEGCLLTENENSKLTISYSAAPIQKANGDIDGVVIVFKDVTEKLALEERLKQSEKMRMIGQLTGGISHDFNNLLTGISGATEMLLLQNKDKLDAQSINYLKTILSTTHRGAELSKKLISFTNTSDQKASIFDVDNVLAEAITIFESTSDRKIKTIYDKRAKNMVISGFESALHSAILNILLNSAHAMPNGGSITIVGKNIILDDVECKRSNFSISSGDFLELKITDNGFGIDEKNLPQLFEPFFTTKDIGEGTGLGLATAYAIIVEHKGAIEINSERGVGTTVTIQLPITKQKIKHTKERNLNHRPSKKGRILLVDDEQMILETTSTFLKLLGYQVTCCLNGEEAADSFFKNEREFQTVVIDMNMPKMDGVDAIRKIREKNKTVPIILATGYSVGLRKQTSSSLDIQLTLIKPYRLSDLEKALYDLNKVTIS